MRRIGFKSGLCSVAILIASCGEFSGLRSTPPLTVAVANGDVSRVEALLEAGANPNIDDPSLRQERPLVVAVEHGHQRIADLLISAGADINGGGGGVAPVSRSPTKEMAQYLIARGASVDYRALHGSNIFGTACAYDRISVVEVLFDHGANIRPGACVLCSCVRTSSVKMTELLIAHGAQVNERAGWGFRRRTPLYFAIAELRSDQVRALLDHGADVNAEATWGETPLQFAVERGRAFAAGACRPSPGPRCAELENSSREIEQLLIARGAKQKDAAP